MKMAIASAMLQKTDNVKVTTTMTQHWCKGIDNEDTMRGKVFTEALQLKPGFTIVDIIITIVEV